MKKYISNKIKQEEKIERTVQFKKSNIANSVVVSFLIGLILAFITYDYNSLQNEIEQKIPVITNDLDSLSLYLDKKIPELNKTIEIQERQLQILKDGKSLVIIR